LAAAGESPEEPRQPRGSAYLGAFFVTELNTHVNVFAQGLPLGVRIDFSEDLKLKDSLTVPRLGAAWRFGKSHVLGFGWYDLLREGTEQTENDIELPRRTIPAGTEVKSWYGMELFKLSYTWLFHRDPKVKLGIGGGLFVADLKAGIRAAVPLSEDPIDESFTAPLPMVGGRLSYQVSPKLQFISFADFFFINYEEYSGVLVDVQLFASHQTFKHVGFGAGLNLQTVGVEVDGEDLFWEVSDSFVGVLVLTNFTF
jgi:hypothetical protein